ncbi:recombinase family protein [Massiliimalia massiliensis]|uniref:recombinase family protein n=1 Tax=Massiliimalia massiliensis TaxID=1852384 RepID=UPI001E301532|nr:recombinase family protein [Massiliimalia massiliensis]
MKSTENTNKNLITALYCRLSQEDERLGESLSIENQRLMLQKYAEEHRFPNIRFYVDDGFSGADFNRPDFKRLMTDVECGKVGIVIVKDQSRLGRDYLQTGMLMEITFPQYDVRFIAVGDGVDSAKGVSDFSGIKNYFNDFYARDTSRKIRAVQRAKGERGERVSSATPYGYMRNPDNKKELIPDPETAPIVKRIFEMCANGMGVGKICDKLSEEQVVSPSVYAFKTTGSKSGQPDLTRPYHWAQTTVRKMLENREYVGDTVNFKTYSKSNKLKKRLKNDPENILIFENTHEAIVDRKTFDLVQKHYEGRRRPDKHGETDKYAGYLFCGDCGKRLYLHRAKENVFACAGHKKRTTDCTMHYIRESVLDQIVLHNLKTVTAYAREQPEEFYAMATQNGEAEAKKFYKTAEREKAQIEKRIKELDNIIRCLYEDRVCGRLSPERYDVMSGGYEQEQAELRQELKSITERIDQMDMREMCIWGFMDKAKSYIEMPKLTPELLRVFIRRIEVYEKFEKYSRTCGNPIIIHYAFQLPEQNGMPALEQVMRPIQQTA